MDSVKRQPKILVTPFQQPEEMRPVYKFCFRERFHCTKEYSFLNFNKFLLKKCIFVDERRADSYALPRKF